MSDEHYVIIGDGPAGNQAAFTLRTEAPDARITVISRNLGPCYKPFRLPDYIAGRIEEKDLYLSPLASYKDKNIKLRCGQQVVGLHIEDRELILGHKEILPFTGLIIAVGGRPRIPEPLLVYRNFMYTLKSMSDAKVWIENLAQVHSILIIGGDLTSFAITKALLHMDKKVSFMLDDDAFWPIRSNEALLNEAGRKLSDRGVHVLKCRKLRRIARVSDHHFDVNADGQKIETEMIGAFFGLVPDIGFLTRSGLAIDRGIMVDQYLNTGFDGIYATGDCAQIYHPEIRDYWISIGHKNALALGRLAALNLVGGKISARPEGGSIYDLQGMNVNTSWWVEF